MILFMLGIRCGKVYDWCKEVLEALVAFYLPCLGQDAAIYIVRAGGAAGRRATPVSRRTSTRLSSPPKMVRALSLEGVFQAASPKFTWLGCSELMWPGDTLSAYTCLG